jgi:DNA-binding beta-propeller fold protein YncE
MIPIQRCLALVALAIVAIAAAPMPLENRIPAVVTRTIAGSTTNPLIMPTDVAIDSSGRVFVADGVNDRIVRFSSRGEFESELRGPAGSRLSRPIAVAIDTVGTLWICDTGNHRLVKQAPATGNYEIVNLPAASADSPADPTGVTIRTDLSRTYVADCGNHRVLLRDNATGVWTPLGEWGVSLGQFRWPFMLCMGEENHLLVTESIGARVQQIASDNRWGGQIGHFGVALGDLYRPKGVAVDSAGRILVGDSTLGVIQAFDPGGNLLGVLTDDSGQPLRLNHPIGMRFDSAGALYVVELGANRVAVITLKPQPATAP